MGPRAALHVATERFAAEVLGLFLAGGVVLTALTLCVVVVSAPGPHPGTRLALLVTLLVAWGAACWRADSVAAAFMTAARRGKPRPDHSGDEPERAFVARVLRVEPWPWPVLVRVLALVAALMLVLVVDGEGRASPLSDQQYILIGIAAIVGGWFVLITTWFVLNAGFIGMTALGMGNRAVLSEPTFADLVSTTAAVVVVGVLFHIWRATSQAIPTRLEGLRLGDPAFTLALSRAITDPSDRPALPRPSPRSLLDDEELLVVDRLAAGDAPKQIAWDLQWSLAKVRKRIATAKKKTAAKTLAELAVLAAPPSQDLSDP